MTTDSSEFYRSLLEPTSREIENQRKRRNTVTVLRVLFFVALIYGIVAMIIFSFSVWAWLEVAFLAVFIGLGVTDRRIVHCIRHKKTLLAECRLELAYLDGDTASLPDGAVFNDPHHPYTKDLDIFGPDSLFQRIDRSVTIDGAAVLATWLKNPLLEADRIRKRQQAVEELAAKALWRLDFRVEGKLYETDKTDLSRLYDAESHVPFFSRPWQRPAIFLLNAVTILAWLGAFAGWVNYQIPIWLLLFQLLLVGVYVKRTNRLHNRLSGMVKSLEGYSGMITLVRQQTFYSEKLAGIKKTLEADGQDATAAIRQLVHILGGFDQRANILVAIFLNGLYTRDLHLVMRLEKWKERYGARIEQWFGAVCRLDALAGMAGFRFNHPEYIFPDITDEVLLDADHFGHPLLRPGSCVTNDFQVRKLHELYIVTGANMAGKSTFLRTVGVNLVLALSGNAVYASRMRCSPMSLFTSMRTTDDLSKGTSYFHAELLRLQQLVEVAKEREKVFIILDEMLKGTNSQDKLNGSLRFLVKLLQYPVSGLVATHDLALGELREEYPENFINACFEIEHTDDDVTYDYKLRPGVSQNMNATILLEKMDLI